MIFVLVSLLLCRREGTVLLNERSCFKILRQLLGIKALFHILLFLKKEISALSRLSALPRGTIGK